MYSRTDQYQLLVLVMESDRNLTFQAFDIIGILGLLGFQQDQDNKAISIWTLVIIYAGINAIFYYIWDVIKSAYKQVKEENITNSYPQFYSMKIGTDNKPMNPYHPNYYQSGLE